MDAQTVGWIVLAIIMIGLTAINITTPSKDSKHKRNTKQHIA